MGASILTFPYHSLHLFLSFFTSSLLLTAGPHTDINSSPQWTRLPTLSPLGSSRKSTVCSGCLLPVDTGVEVHQCTFFIRGFKIKSTSFQPCKVMYHARCIRVGPPFRTRHFGKGTQGMQYPPCATNLPFICELCTTRAQIGRELDPSLLSDVTLLVLERMRMIDAAHAWAPRILENACRTLKRVDKFFKSFTLPPLHAQLQLPTLSHPPLDISIPIFGAWIITPHTHPLEVTEILPHGTLLVLNVRPFLCIAHGRRLSVSHNNTTKIRKIEY